MKNYALKEIKYLWRLYKTPIFKTNKIDSITEDMLSMYPGKIIATDDDISEFYRFDNNMSFPEFIEFMEDKESERLMKKLKE